MAINYNLYMCGLSDTGCTRTYNEDAIAWQADCGLAVLADGMGGHNAGDVASRMCVDLLSADLVETLSKPLKIRANKDMSRHATLLRRAINHANEAVFAAAEANADYKGMGTTLVTTLFYADKVILAHVGDSRIYRLRNRELAQVTSDHSLIQELLDKGVISAEDAADNPYGHVITRALGVQASLVAEIRELEAQSGDVYLLCSDGLSDLVGDDEIRDTLIAASGSWERAAQRLVDLANQHGGVDNISVVLVAVGARVLR